MSGQNYRITQEEYEAMLADYQRYSAGVSDRRNLGAVDDGMAEKYGDKYREFQSLQGQDDAGRSAYFGRGADSAQVINPDMTSGGAYDPNDERANVSTADRQEQGQHAQELLSGDGSRQAASTQDEYAAAVARERELERLAGGRANVPTYSAALGGAGQYGQPNDPMAYNDPRRGGNVPGMEYNRTAPPPMSRPQGRNTQLPQYGTDDFMPVGQGAPNHAPITTMSPQGFSAPMTPPTARQKPAERPRYMQNEPTMPHPSTYSMAQPRRTKPAGDPLPLLQNQPNSTTPRSASRALPAGSAPYQPSSVPGPQQAAPGTPGTGMSMPQQNPAMQSPEKIAQQQALAKMALSGGTTVKAPWMP